MKNNEIKFQKDQVKMTKIKLNRLKEMYKNQIELMSKNSEKQEVKQKNRAKKFQSSHSNRLGGLVYHPDLIPEHKQMLQSKMSTVNFARRCVQYGGCGLFLLHMVKNRLRLSRYTGLFIAVPPILSYAIKIFGYMWVDNYAQRSGLYKIYKISTL